jgi:peptide/nickel transport system ATP-binding protein
MPGMANNATALEQALDAGPALLQVEDLRTWIDHGGGTVRAVDGVSLRIARGETFALLGESGCGKSMLALSILRLLPEGGRIMGGRVQLGDIDLLALTERGMRDIRGGRIAMIFQEPALSLNPVLSVGDQVAEAVRRHTSLRQDEVGQRVIDLLQQAGVPDPAARRNEYPFQLSGGLIQRVMIAMALAGEPELLIADEPTTALDVTIQAQVLELLRSLQQRAGLAILLITHDLGVAAQNAQRVAVMYAGEIVECAPRDEFFSRPSHPYARKLFAALPRKDRRDARLAALRGTVPPLSREFSGCRFAERCDHAWELCRREAPSWTAVAPGHGVRCHLYSADGVQRPAFMTAQSGASAWSETATAAEAAPLLTVDDLAVHFPVRRGLLLRTVKKVKAVDGVSLAISPGRTVALVGESGCGKTTAGKAIVRLLPTTRGSIRFDGAELAGLERRRVRPLRAQFQIIFQDPYSSLDPRMRIGEIIGEGLAALGVGADESDRARRIDSLLEQVGLPAEAKRRYPHEFSGGQRQRIAIARALGVHPRLIVCDEPTSALDISAQAQILNLLKELQARQGLAYLFISHNLAVVEYLAHRVCVMYLGRIVEQGRMEDVLSAPRHPYTQALLAAVPMIERETGRRVIRLPGDLPSPADPPRGCHFHPRCPQVRPECREVYPAPTAFGATHTVCCHLYGPGQRHPPGA